MNSATNEYILSAMRFNGRSAIAQLSNARLRIYFSTIVTVAFGIIAGLSFKTLDIVSERSFPLINFIGGEDLQTNVSARNHSIGSDIIPSQILVAETDLYLRRAWGDPAKDLTFKPKYLVTFTVGYEQRNNVDACVRKFSEKFTIILFHYDGRASDWQEFEWFDQVIHVSGRTQTKWWYVKRFLHPDIVAPYDYIFVWDEDLGLQNFDPDEYLKIVKKHGLEISQPGLEPNRPITWHLTVRQPNIEFHRSTTEGWCPDPKLPPCAGFVEIMAPIFSRAAWQCVWFLIQNDLTHGWGLDFNLNRCVDNPHMTIGVVDSQWIVHHGVPSLVKQDGSQNNEGPGGVRKRCFKEWDMFNKRIEAAERAASDVHDP